MEEKVKAVGLFSGGLDSILAAILMIREGIEVHLINFKTIFWDKTSKSKISPKNIAEQIGAIFEEEDVSLEYLEIVKHPKHGYGSNMNPCIDCKIFFMKKAKEFMEDIGAKFIFTGEVLGQRPMTQNREMIERIPRLAGVEDICLRPLCAKLLPPTLPEREGWVNRDNLLDFQGRGRRSQMELAEVFSIKDYPTPAGGCLLTEPGFSGRLSDLITNDENFEINDILLLKVGRHFRFAPNIKCIVGRKESDNLLMANLTKESDILFELDDVPCPLVILRGKGCEIYLKEAAALCKRYSDAKNLPEISVKYWKADENTEVKIITAEIVDENYLRDKMVRSLDE